MVLLGIDVEHGHRHVGQVHLAVADLDAVIDEAVALVELAHKLAERLAGLIG